MESWDVVFFGEGADLSSKEKSQKGIPKPNPSGFDSFKGVSHPWKNIVTCFFPTISSNLKRCCVWFMFLLENPTHSNKKKTTPRFSPWICQLADLQLLLMLLDQGSKKFTKLSYLDGWKDHWPTREECFFLGGNGKKTSSKRETSSNTQHRFRLFLVGCFWGMNLSMDKICKQIISLQIPSIILKISNTLAEKNCQKPHAIIAWHDLFKTTCIAILRVHLVSTHVVISSNA